MTARLRPLSVLCLAALLTACTGSRTPELGELPPNDLKGNAEQLLQQAGQSKPDEALLLRLAAADKALAAGDLAMTQNILQSLDLNTTQATQKVFAATLSAELSIARDKPKAALQALQQPAFASLDQLPVSLQLRSRIARANALQLDGQALAAARERVQLAHSLKDKAALDNHEKIWSLVSSLPRESLQSTAPAGDELGGWLQLATQTHDNATLAQQSERIRKWVASNPLHPAAMQLPAQLTALQELSTRPLTHVALLLPQQGPLQNAANALRDGFLAAHYQQQGNGGDLKVSLYDSTQISSLAAFYNQARADGVQLVVGPLEKPLVSQLRQQSELPITTLALNYSDTQATGPAQLFQFGLSAEDEAREVARRAHEDGKLRAVALVPNNEWGNRVLNAFRQEWQAQGGQLTDVAYIDQPGSLSGQVGELMQLRSSEARIKQMRDVLKNENLEAQPVRRQDIDMVFLAATPAQARQVKPTLAFQYASDLPVYATSHLFAGDRASAQELNGIRFCETPWMLQSNNNLRTRISGQWPDASSAVGRLYAMGADAYGLAPRLEQLRTLPGTQMEGLTGNLSLGQDQRVVRRLPWAEYRDGQVTLLDSLPQ